MWASFSNSPRGEKKKKHLFRKINWRLLLFAVGFCSFLGTFLVFAEAENKLKGAFSVFAEIVHCGKHVLVFAIG